MVERVSGRVSFLPVGQRGGLGACSRASRVLAATVSSLRGRGQCSFLCLAARFLIVCAWPRGCLPLAWAWVGLYAPLAGFRVLDVLAPLLWPYGP